MLNNQKTGLVLSGGGAKGAYQAGVIKALAELDIKIDCISGASIGALNGAVVTSSESLTDASKRMYALWQRLAKESPLKANTLAIAKKILLAAGFAIPKSRMLLHMTATLLSYFSQENDAALSDTPLYKLIKQYLPDSGLPMKPELYVSLYESQGGAVDLLKIFAAIAKIKDTAASKPVHVQSLAAGKQKIALAASAAIPLAFAPKKIDGQKYSDGGQGGWNKLQGNTPIKPLIDAGCDLAIVTHLEDGSLWNRHDFPEITVLEIRPQTPISKNSLALMDMFDFSQTSINDWIQQGYTDTLNCIARVTKALETRQNLKSAVNDCQASLANNELADKGLDDAMNRLRSD